ncbi:hypothetical protein RvY_07484 [Ramazzottius varieornatus]|uniref:Uncharacterized protein n=1 Tax=Ramazzottius varieornatus TaxID=947166 RepID=A0A1D1V2D2_RAMVA|nr:hypothetical protein RvY_07484 [Ramazzottius varieornatus]
MGSISIKTNAALRGLMKLSASVQKGVLYSLLGHSPAQRIVFCDSVFPEQALAITEKHPLPSPLWANSCVEEIVFRNCQVHFQPLVPEEDARGTIENFTLRLANHLKSLDLVSIVRDVPGYRPHVQACEKHISLPLLVYENKFRGVVGKAARFVVERMLIS